MTTRECFVPQCCDLLADCWVPQRPPQLASHLPQLMATLAQVTCRLFIELLAARGRRTGERLDAFVEPETVELGSTVDTAGHAMQARICSNHTALHRCTPRQRTPQYGVNVQGAARPTRPAVAQRTARHLQPEQWTPSWHCDTCNLCYSGAYPLYACQWSSWPSTRGADKYGNSPPNQYRHPARFCPKVSCSTSHFDSKPSINQHVSNGGRLAYFDVLAPSSCTDNTSFTKGTQPCRCLHMWHVPLRPIRALATCSGLVPELMPQVDAGQRVGSWLVHLS